MKAEKLLDILGKIEDYLLALVLFVALSMSFLQIIIRNFAGFSIIWLDPAVNVLVLWLAFLGASAAARKQKHISMDALSRLMPGRWLHLLQLLIGLIAAATCVLLAWYSFGLVRMEKDFGTTTFLELPIWVVQTIMPFSLLVMSLRFIAQAAVSGRMLFARRSG